MKNLRNITLMGLTAALAILGSCTKKETTTNNTTGTTTGVLTCKVNGVAWQSLPAKNMYINTAGDTTWGTKASLIAGQLSVQGVNIVGKDSSMVGFMFVLTPNKTGKYEGTFNASAQDGALYFPKSDNNTVLAIALGYTVTYSVTLTKVDEAGKRVSGVFTITEKAPSGSGMPDYLLTEGSFTDIVLE